MHKAISIFILTAFISASVKTPSYAEADPMPWMPRPGVRVPLSPEYTSAYLKGIVIHPENALKFDFIIYKGDKELTEAQKRTEYTKLTKYFLASLAIPDDDQWVNLSPYEKDRIIKDDFGKTEMGRDLLAQDYMLKQITASLIYPEDHLGKIFWNKVYAKAQTQFGTTNIPVNTFNKVWVLPDDALIYEKGNTAYVLRNHLRVMLEEDYLFLQKHSGITDSKNNVNSLGSQVVRAIVLPELQREVNEGKNFAPLRQVYSGMLLAAWYKKALKESLLSKIYANKARVKGVDQDPKTNEAIYQQYLKAYKKGVFNFIKEDVDKYTHEIIPRKYFSGGEGSYSLSAKYFDRATIIQITSDSAQLGEINSSMLDVASVSTNVAKPDSAMTIILALEVVAAIVSVSSILLSHLRGQGNQRKQTRVVPKGEKLSYYDLQSALPFIHTINEFEEYKQISIKVMKEILNQLVPMELSKGNKPTLLVSKPKGELLESYVRDILKALVGNHGDVKEDGGFFILNYPEPDDLSHPSKSEWYRRGYLNAWAWALIAYARRQNGARQPWADTVLYDSFRRLDESEILRRVKVLKSQEVLDNGEMRFAAATKDDKEWLALMFALMSSVLKGFQITYHQDEVRLIYDDNPFLNGQQGLEYRKGSMDFISAYLKQALRIIEEKLQLSKAMIAAGFSTKSHRSIANDSAMSSYDKGRLLTGIALIFLSQLAEDGLPIQLLKGSSLHHYSLVMLLATVGATAGLVRIFNTLVPPDKATVSAHPKARPFGGIDLNAANLAMTIKRDGKGVPLPFAQQDMAQLNLIEGLEPEILSIKPASSLPNFADLFKD